MFIQGSLASHLEISVQIHHKGEEVIDLSLCCNLLLSVEIAALWLDFSRLMIAVAFWALSVCLRDIVGEYLHYLPFVPVHASSERKKGGGMSAGYQTAEAFWHLLAFSRRTQRKPFMKDCLVYSHLKICHCNSFLIILLKSYI